MSDDLRKSVESVMFFCRNLNLGLGGLSRSDAVSAVANKLALLGLTVTQPLTRERAREIWVNIDQHVADTFNNSTAGLGATEEAIAAAADRLIQLLGPVPTRRVTRAELLAAHDAAIAASHDEHGIQDRRGAIVGVLARRLGLEVGD